jgi:hypothetical protein
MGILLLIVLITKKKSGEIQGTGMYIKPKRDTDHAFLFRG